LNLKLSGNFYRNLPLFSYFPKSALPKARKIFNVKKYNANSIIISQNAKGDYLYIVVSGLVKIYRTSETGSVRKTLAILKRNEFFGEMALFDHSGRSASALAITDVEVIACKRNDFLKLLSKYSQSCFLIISLLVSRLREADKQISSLTFQNALGRVAIIIGDLCERHGLKNSRGILIDMDLTHQDIAEMAGTAREVVTKIISVFKRAQCLKFEGKRMTVTNLRKIRGWIY